MRNKCDVTGMEFEGQGVYMKAASGKRYYVSQGTFALFLLGHSVGAIRLCTDQLAKALKEDPEFFSGAYIDEKPVMVLTAVAPKSEG